MGDRPWYPFLIGELGFQFEILPYTCVLLRDMDWCQFVKDQLNSVYGASARYVEKWFARGMPAADQNQQVTEQMSSLKKKYQKYEKTGNWNQCKERWGGRRNRFDLVLSPSRARDFKPSKLSEAIGQCLDVKCLVPVLTSFVPHTCRIHHCVDMVKEGQRWLMVPSGFS